MLKKSTAAIILSFGFVAGPLQANDFKEKNEKTLLEIASQIESIKSVARTDFETEEQFELRRKALEEQVGRSELSYELFIPYRGINTATYDDKSGVLFYNPQISSFVFTMPVGVIDFLYNNKVVNTYSGKNSYGASTQVRELETYNYILNLASRSEVYLSNYLRYEGGDVVPSYLKKPNDPPFRFDRIKSVITGEKCSGSQGQCVFGVVYKNPNGDDQAVAKNIAVKLIMKIEKSRNSYKYQYEGRLNTPTFSKPDVYIPVKRIFDTYISKVVFFNKENNQTYMEKVIELDEYTLKMLESRKLEEYRARFVKPSKEPKFSSKKFGVYSGYVEFELKLADRQKGRHYFSWDTKTFDDVEEARIINMSCNSKDGKEIECGESLRSAILLHVKDVHFNSVKDNVLYRMNF